MPEVWGIPVPAVLFLGGVLAGMLLALLARLANGAGARRRARKAKRSLRARVEAVAADLVIGPVEEELAVHEQLYDALARALGEGGRLRLRR